MNYLWFQLSKQGGFGFKKVKSLSIGGKLSITCDWHGIFITTINHISRLLPPICNTWQRPLQSQTFLYYQHSINVLSPPMITMISRENKIVTQLARMTETTINMPSKNKITTSLQNTSLMQNISRILLWFPLLIIWQLQPHIHFPWWYPCRPTPTG